MFEKIIEKIEKYESIVIFGHINPDGDCFGSQVALKHILKEHYPNKNVLIYGNGLPVFESLLGETDYVPESCVEVSLAVVLDCNDLTRVDDEIVYSALDFVKIDHHIDLHSFKEGPEVIETTCSSTCELVYLFATENKLVIPKVAAEAIYLGMMTDSGRFQYTNNYVQMFDVLKNLMILGVEPTKITAILNSTNIFSLKIKSFIYRHIKKDKAGILYVYATKKERERIHATSAQITMNTGLLSNVKKYPVWLIASETDNGGLQVEMRSNLINVQEIAVCFGGGGHTFAAGFTYKTPKEGLFEELLEKIRAALKKGK